MRHAARMTAQHGHWVAATKGAMARVEQQMRGRACGGHEGVDLLGRFHDRAHMVVIGEGDALGR